jgi:hypothetical protein
MADDLESAKFDCRGNFRQPGHAAEL